MGHDPLIFVSCPEQYLPCAAPVHTPLGESGKKKLLCGKWQSSLEKTAQKEAWSPGYTPTLLPMFSGLPFEGLRLKTDPRSPSSTLPSYYDEARGPGLVAEWGVVCVRLAAQLSDPVDCSPPGSSVHRIFQARILDCYFLLQGIFPSQVTNLHLTYCRQILNLLSHRVASEESLILARGCPICKMGIICASRHCRGQRNNAHTELLLKLYVVSLGCVRMAGSLLF